MTAATNIQQSNRFAAIVIGKLYSIAALIESLEDDLSELVDSNPTLRSKIALLKYDATTLHAQTLLLEEKAELLFNIVAQDN